MSQQAEMATPQTEQLAAIMAEIAEKSQKLVADFAERQNGKPVSMASGSPMAWSQAYMDLSAKFMNDPFGAMQNQFELWQDYVRLWQTTSARMWGQDMGPVATPERGDRRFKDPAWEENPVFDFVKQSYLLTSRYLMDAVSAETGLDEKTQHKLEFYTRQFVDAMAPSNFVMTNPAVLKETLDTRGENLLRGLKNMLDDLERGKGKLSIRMTDLDAFEIGKNIAVTPCKVVFQTDLMQLLQYEPTTEQVHKRPLLIIPPWINKYYILDLQPKNSFIKYAVEQGFTVFVVSWVNPDEEFANKSFEDYMEEGPLAALDAIYEATGEKDINAIGYCLGGTLLSATLAYMNEKKDNRIKAATFFTTMTDFSDAGDLAVFIDEEQLASLEQSMAKQGFLDGSQMATTFNMLRANDLIWSFVVNNYLLGKDPFPFDLLYWNSDSTRMPAAMHSFYLRKCYQENKLIEPGAVTLKGVPIDLRRIKTPAYWLSTREDHIAPWKATYAATQIFAGPKKFVLAGSGHIAGVINPPSSGKYGFWTNEDLPSEPEAWLDTADQNDGSWWDDWSAWNASHSLKNKVPARVPGDGDLAVIEDGPGAFVKVRVN